MAIVKVGTYRNPPEDITDYEAIVSHLEAYTRQVGNQGMILTEWTNTTTEPKIAMGSYISHGGVLYVVEEEDYSLPALSIDGTYYIRVAVSGATLALDYIADLTGYVWNAIYNGLYHPDGKQVLPYRVAKNASAIEKYKMLNPWQVDDFAVVNYLGRYHGRELHVTGAISGASIDTGKGATEVHLMDQNIRTSDSVEFASVLASLNPLTAVQGTFIVPENETYIIPRGLYVMFGFYGGIYLEYYSGTSWSGSTPTGPLFLISDGTNTRFRNGGVQVGIKYLKF